jgi:broad specificity phosphatase PhoE
VTAPRTIRLVRHGRATAGWDVDPDPSLDGVGREQSAAAADHLGELGELAIVTSPLRRARETAAFLAARTGSEPLIEPRVAEVPSPEGYEIGERVGWLRRAMAGEWSDLADRYTDFRDGVVEFVRSIDVDTVVFSHFVAINAVIGACIGDDRVVIRSLDNCSITTVEVDDGGLRLIHGGFEADTLIR